MTERAAFIGENNSAGLADEEFAVPVRFQLPDLVADGRGTYAQFVGGILETETTSGDFEGA